MGGSYSTTSATTSSSETPLETPLEQNDDSLQQVVKEKEPTVAQPDISNKNVEMETETKDGKTQTVRLERLKASYQNLRPLFNAVRSTSPSKEWDIMVENVVQMIRSDKDFMGDEEWLKSCHLPKLNQEAIFPDHFYKPLSDFALCIHVGPDMFFLPPDALWLEYWVFRYMAYKHRDTYRHPVAELDKNLTCLFAALWRVWMNFNFYEGMEFTEKERYQRDRTMELSCPNKVKVFAVALYEFPSGLGQYY